MDALILPETGALGLLVAPRPLRNRLVTDLAVRLALAGPLRVLDCGNSFAAHTLARELRRRTPQVTAALQRIHIARAFTCHQVVTLLSTAETAVQPILIPELLSTFLDESEALPARRRLLQSAVQHLQRLSSRAPVVVSAPLQSEGRQPGTLLRGAPKALPDPTNELLALLEQAAGSVWRFEPPDTPPAPLRLPGF
jgi:hypothetical protein